MMKHESEPNILAVELATKGIDLVNVFGATEAADNSTRDSPMIIAE